MVRRAWLAPMVAAWAAGLAGCDPGFESPAIVRDLRMLAIRATPPEVVLDFDPEHPEDVELPPVGIEALVVDPRGGTFDWGMTACPPTRSARCDDPEAPYVEVGFGTFDPAGEPIRAELQVNPILIEAAVRADSLLGFGGVAIQVELWVKPAGAPIEEAIFGSKKVVYAPRIPEQRVANRNPDVEELRADGVTFAPGRCADPDTAPLPVLPGRRVELWPVEPEGVRETYVLPTFEGGVRTLTEYLMYSWFATAGSFSSNRSGGRIDPFGNEPPLDVTWTAPEDPRGPVSLWLVQRDERLGLSWWEHCFMVEE